MSRAAGRAGSTATVVVGPAPPLRGGIASHTARLVEACRAGCADASAVSWSRLYPSALFPGRSQRLSGPRPSWCDEALDSLDPRSWRRAGAGLAAGDATVVVQWWHPFFAPALAAATRSVPSARLAAVVHNVLPHEPFPFSAALARRVLGRCGKLVCHGEEAASALAALLGSDERIGVVEMPCLLPAAAVAAARRPPELAGLGHDARLVVAAGHLRRYKRTSALAAAWASIERPAAARLVFAGESYLGAADRESLRRAAAADPTVFLLDRYLDDEELAWILAAADAVVATPGAASQSGVLPVAAALGTPVIVRRAAGEDAPGGGAWMCRRSAARGGASARRSVGKSTKWGLTPFSRFSMGDDAALAAALAETLAAPPAPDPELRLAAFDTEAFLAGWRRVVEAIGIALRP